MAKVLGGSQGQLKFSLSSVVMKYGKKIGNFFWKSGKQAISKAPLRGKNKLREETFSVNNAASDSSPWKKVEWVHVKVGDIVELSRDEEVSADIVMLHADGREGVAYVETMALDGETNLKSRYPVPQLKCGTVDELSSCNAHFVVEDPNLDLYDFHGKVTVEGTTLPLTLSNVIFRGSIVRNTAQVIGIVINTGEECKIRMNASKNPEAKSPAIQKMTLSGNETLNATLGILKMLLYA
jgi:magnesium-transporting ATPase (P-type)